MVSLVVDGDSIVGDVLMVGGASTTMVSVIDGAPAVDGIFAIDSASMVSEDGEKEKEKSLFSKRRLK